MADPEDSPDPARHFLRIVADPDRPAIAIPTTVVVAHPDDETIGCGAIMPRFADVTLIHVTDGAPANGVDASALGYHGPVQYAAARRRELETAMAVAGVAADCLEALGCPDQEASDRLVDLATELAIRLAGREIVLTHAYEGGHPDHDAVAFAVHAACRMLGQSGPAPAIVEMPLYRAGPEDRGAEDWDLQTFEPDPANPETVVALTPEERTRKQLMFAAHLSQIQVLARFTVYVERYRRAPAYDFWRLPNGGRLLYERNGWGMTGERWADLARTALVELGTRGEP